MENWVKYLLLISIFIIIIGLDLLLYFKTDKLIDEMQIELANLEKIIESENIDKSKTEAEKVREKWKNRENVLSFFIEHEEVEKVSLKIAVIEENSKNEEYVSALEDIAETKFLLEHIQDKYNLTWKNIF